MAGPAAIVYLKCLIICASMSSLVSPLTLNQATSKPRHTKFSSSTTDSGSGSLVTPTSTSATTKDNSGVAYYRLFNSKTDSTCILLKTDALVEVKFKLHDLDERADSFISDEALIEGNCGKEDTQLLRISWTGYSLVIIFEKTPGGERWFIKNIELSISKDLPKFHGISKQGNNAIKLYHKGMLIPTPVGRSYSCGELDIDLETDKDDNPPPGLEGSLLLRLLQVQPFMYRGENFDPPFECRDQTFVRDETAPIAVGSTLAIAVLVTISGYGVYRYFKVKNVQYNTME